MTWLSLLLFAGTILLAIRSFWQRDRLVVQSGSILCSIDSIQATLTLEIDRDPTITQAAQQSLSLLPLHCEYFSNPLPDSPYRRDYVWCFQSFRVGDVFNRRTLAKAGVYFPLWTVLVATAVLPGCRIMYCSKANRSNCATCGYDLRATPDRCPECGAVPAASRSEDSPSKSTANEPVHG